MTGWVIEGECPNCNKTITIETEKTSICPQCNTALNSNAVICINCGHNVLTGNTLTTNVSPAVSQEEIKSEKDTEKKEQPKQKPSDIAATNRKIKLIVKIAFLFIALIVFGPSFFKFLSNRFSLGKTNTNDLISVEYPEAVNCNKLPKGSKDAKAKQLEAVGKENLPLEAKSSKTGILFRLIPNGTFTIGSSYKEREICKPSITEKQATITLSKPFYVSKYEVTQEEWKKVMGTTSNGKSRSDKKPVNNVSWDDTQEFLKKLCEIEGVPQGTYSLLTEAQWEYACRAGTTTPYSYGNSLLLLGKMISSSSWGQKYSFTKLANANLLKAHNILKSCDTTFYYDNFMTYKKQRGGQPIKKSLC